MAHQCIKYRLTAEGTIPDFVCTQPNSLSGMYAVDTKTHAYPQELLLVGLSVKNATGDFEVIPTRDALLEYLLRIGADWKVQDSASSTLASALNTPFDHSAASLHVWNRMTAMNAA
jgi:hypothetical protein